MIAWHLNFGLDCLCLKITTVAAKVCDIVTVNSEKEHYNLIYFKVYSNLDFRIGSVRYFEIT